MSRSRRKPPRRPTAAKPMTLEELEAWLDASSPRAHAAGASMIDGFLAGLIVGPDFVPPEEWMWQILGPHARMGATGTPAAAAVATIIAHYNHVAKTLAEQPHKYAPIFMREDNGTVLAQDWAAGFYGAMKLRLSAWEPLLSSGYDAMGPLMPIFVNCPGADGVPLFGLLPAAINKAWADEAWRHIPEAVVTLYKHWAPQRKAQVRA